jgi:uncharacterized protein
MAADASRPVNLADKPLHALSDDEWEQLCDGCGRCCMHKFENEETGEVFYTTIACRLFDDAACRCRDYENRQQSVPDCLQIRALSLAQMRWLPPSCAYRLRAEGKPLPAWHPLVTGDSESVHTAGISMRGRSTPVDTVPEAQWVDFIMSVDDD